MDEAQESASRFPFHANVRRVVFRRRFEEVESSSESRFLVGGVEDAGAICGGKSVDELAMASGKIEGRYFG